MSKILEEKLSKKSKEEQNLWAIRHTAEHVLHTAMQNLYPKLKKAMGPATDEGFYFDFDLDEKVNESDFPKIEKEMNRLIQADLTMTQEYISDSEARKTFKGNPFKLDWVNQIKKRGEKLSIYKMGSEDLDLCSGPHVKSTGMIRAFKLLKIAGAYWHGDEKNKMLTRIYGTAFPSSVELDAYLKQLEESEKRDHRKLGQELDLFSTNQLTGQGLILWHPKLATVRNIVEQFWKDVHIKNGYQLVFTPHIAGMDMFVKTRHYTKYINSMFPAMLHQYIEGESKSDYSADEQLKPMNCPNHVQIFKVHPRSYRELPLRMGELGTVYRYERAGVLHGMTRVRGFTQDDSHIFCTPEQVIDEVRETIKLTRYFYEEIFGFKDYQAYLSTRPEEYLGTLEMWDFAQDALKRAMEMENVSFKVDEGAGVFYGPKIDSKVRDSLGREWQLGTIQFDFNLPTLSESSKKDIDDFWELKTFRDKFRTRENLAKYLKQMGRGLDVKFIDKDGQEKTVVMIHRTILGSMERFFGVLIEHYGGAFPLWLAPVQVVVIPISDKFSEYGKTVADQLKNKDIRVELDDRTETMQAKIRDAQLKKMPYMLIVGGREAETGTVAVRLRTGEDLGQIALEALIDRLEKSIASRSNL
ncbi:MAG: Threonine-tRNA ligase [Microgenomates group bacterium GW2011_GWA2_44_7]|uniref:Threonine--tRNA ligase n=1 Tax=Candidatus Woesebacteria bacterium GW2011_GWA1_43_12 TaxID=1618557 RepID=A0A0G1CX71_9BACT|nr:MAG: Threonine-tRNA ligase [Candidatus Woesebacteria bacterium GW2011_GWA1_43_12]KKT76245.1 MAG: Threonine-tRNA ligase [Microgenomates group bacterium GW2011_GWA2_44_7]KKT77719.1 MAG: Threonine-tRNA ligase [Microgenomates group bacterium GW2011_GWB1_44_8]